MVSILEGFFFFTIPIHSGIIFDEPVCSIAPQHYGVLRLMQSTVAIGSQMGISFIILKDVFLFFFEPWCEKFVSQIAQVDLQINYQNLIWDL